MKAKLCPNAGRMTKDSLSVDFPEIPNLIIREAQYALSCAGMTSFISENLSYSELADVVAHRTSALHGK